MANIIKNHNRKILNECEMTDNRRTCNCRNKNLWPLDGKCLTNNVIYKVTVTRASRTTSNYIGMVENDFKTRFNNHKLSSRNQNHSHDTVFSKYIWELKNNDTTYDIKWCIIKTANAYKGNPSCCNLCLSEKLCILTACDTILNKWSKLVTKCHQENKFFTTNHRIAVPTIHEFQISSMVYFELRLKYLILRALYLGYRISVAVDWFARQ